MDDAPLPLTAHLAELRNRLAWSLLAWGAAGIGSWAWREPIFGALLEPATQALGPDGGSLQAIAPTEIFFTYLKCALLAGFAISLPVILWQVWAFISPGLYPSEKKLAVPFVLSSSLLFAGGASFGYAVVFPLVFDFFASFSSDFVESAWTMREVFAVTTRLLLAFGIGFQLPVVVFFLSAAGLVDPRQFLAGLKYAVIVAFVLAAALTPPDVVSQILLALPLIVLYVLGVAVSFLFARKREDDPE
jgi:sec-independent protein translocase protein TatC